MTSRPHNSNLTRFLSSAVGSEFMEPLSGLKQDTTTHDKDQHNATAESANVNDYISETGDEFTTSSDFNYEPKGHYTQPYYTEQDIEDDSPNSKDHRFSHITQSPKNDPLFAMPLDGYLFSHSPTRATEGLSEKVDALTQLQSEHDAYISILEATHLQEIQALKKELADTKALYSTSAKSKELQQQVEKNLASMRAGIEEQLRKKADEDRHNERELSKSQFKEAMAKEVERISVAIREEAKIQLQAQVQSMRQQLESQVRAELQTETEHKLRLALVQQMRPQVRAELEQALRMEIRTVYSQEIRKEVEATLAPEIEKRIASEYKTKHSRAQGVQKEQVEAAVQAQLAVARKELEDRVRRDAEASVARKVSKKVEAEVRSRVEKMRQEIRSECEAEAQKHVESSFEQLKQERAEIARLRSVENVRRAREEAVHKEAEAEFHKKVAEFRRYVQEEEARVARMKAVVQWRDDHPRRPSSGLSTATPNTTISKLPPNSNPHSTFNHVPNLTTPTTNSPTTPTTAPPMASTAIPTVIPNGASTRSPSPQRGTQQATRTPSPVAIQTSPKSTNPTKPSGLAFDFTFDVKLIAAKLISDARDTTHEALRPAIEQLELNEAHKFNNSVNSSPKNSYPARGTPSPSRTPSPVRQRSPASPGYTLGQIATEQRAQKEFENQPPIVPPQGALGARLRVLLPRLYQLWDESETSHIHRLDFSNALRVLDVSQAERRVAMEIARLRKVIPAIQKEMTLVARREQIKARLAQDAQGNILGPAEKAALQAELRRITVSAQVAIAAWESANGQPFMYRGFPYLALISAPT